MEELSQVSNPCLRGKLTLSLVLVVALNCGCQHNDTESVVLKQKETVLKQLDELYSQYINGGQNTARQRLLSSISILENATCLDNGDRAQLLSLEYSRLAVMDHKVGEKVAEDAYVLCAQYWQLKTSELSGEPLKASMEKVKRLDIEEQTALVEKMDKRFRGGKLAEYNQLKEGRRP